MPPVNCLFEEDGVVNPRQTRLKIRKNWNVYCKLLGLVLFTLSLMLHFLAMNVHGLQKEWRKWGLIKLEKKEKKKAKWEPIANSNRATISTNFSRKGEKNQNTPG
jgi:hypothetical protein